MTTSISEQEFYLDFIELLGYGVYNVDGGKMEPSAKFAVADPLNDEDGFYLEADTIEELFNAFDEFLKAGGTV